MVDPAFGLFTLGVNSGGGTARFEYFAVDGSTGCEEPEPENRAPVIDAAAASPTSGFAPLQVAFSVTASDPDTGDTLTYAWDFDGDGDVDSTDEDPTYTYTAAGDYEAEVTVSDGEAERSRTVAGHRARAGRPGGAVPRAGVLQDRRLPARLDRRGACGDRAAGRMRTPSRSTTPRTRPRSATRS